MEDPKLVLQIDPRELFMMVDHTKGSQSSVTQSINLALSKIAYVKKIHFRVDLGEPKEGDYKWHDGLIVRLSILQSESSGADERGLQAGTPLSISERLHEAHLEGQVPPLIRNASRVSTTAISLDSLKFIGVVPEGCKTFYSVFGRHACLSFAEEGPGKIYLSVLMDLKRLLVVSRSYPEVPNLFVKDGAERYHTVLPCFFNLLVRLKMEMRSFNIILQTTKENLEHIAHALDDFINEKHELFNKATQYLNNDSIRCFHRVHWSWDTNEEGDLVLKSGRKDTADIVSEEEVYKFFTSGEMTLGINEEPGHRHKVLWFTLSDSTVHPILIDDDISEEEEDCNVTVRSRRHHKEQFRELSFEESMIMKNVTLIHGDLIQAMLDPWYLVNAVTLCEENLNRIRQNQQFMSLCSGQ